jgi:uncharacterized protein YbjT (DUF2867 family)
MSNRLSVLVIGATGNQGGTLARLLLSRGHRVRGLTRKPESAAARKLQALGAEIATGDMEDRGSLAHAASGMDAVFSVSTPFDAGGPETEARQGMNVADAAKFSGVKHLVYSSVPKADTHTEIPHFESKAQVERHIQSLGIPWTVIGPTMFMENFLGPYFHPELLEGRFAIALSPACKLQLICLDDIAGLAALVLEQRERFLGRRIDIASDERTPPEIADILARAMGRKVRYHQTPIEQVRAWSKDMAFMFEWFDRVGTGIDIAGLRRDYPEVGWHDLRQWAEVQSWDVLTHGAAS